MLKPELTVADLFVIIGRQFISPFHQKSPPFINSPDFAPKRLPVIELTIFAKSVHTIKVFLLINRLM